MPQPALHLALAETLWHRWQRGESTAPASLPPDDDEARMAFLLGALAPDMGYFPGSPLHALSDAVHRDGGTDVARALWASDAPATRAFALGWMTHVLADARIHPLVNRGATALLRAEQVLEPVRLQQLVAHVRVELGIEGWFACPRRGPLQLTEVFRPPLLHDLGAALQRALPVRTTPDTLLEAQRAMLRYAPLCQHLARLLAYDLRRRRHQRTDFLRLQPLRRWASAILPRNSMAFAFLNPVRPPHWLIREVRREVERFPAHFAGLVEARLATAPNYDLNSGAVLGRNARAAAA